MDKYRKGFEEKIKPKMNHETGEYKVEPFRNAQVALVTWLKTEPHAQKEREYLYHTAMALGSVKEKLVGIEMYGSNVKFMAQQNKNAQEGPEENNE
jgi:hypothetical protein